MDYMRMNYRAINFLLQQQLMRYCHEKRDRYFGNQIAPICVIERMESGGFSSYTVKREQ